MKKIIFATLISILGLGISFGVLLINISTVNYVETIPNHIKTATITKNYEMSDQLYFFFPQADYIVDPTLGQTVNLSLTYYPDYVDIANDLSMGIIRNGNFMRYKKLGQFIIDDLAHKTIHNYEKLMEGKVMITATAENIEKLKQNFLNEEQKQDETIYENEYDELYRQIEILEKRNNMLEMDLEQTNLQNEEYKRKLEEYKDKIESLFQE